jgi:pyruvate/2-oxoglutarate dehydrogenase complex dihydrolipoamide dehydrogenase (E3) component
MEIFTAVQSVKKGNFSGRDQVWRRARSIEYDRRKGVHVNDKLQTANKHIYAAGDICLKYKFTHVADATARIVIQNALFFPPHRFSSLVIPWCTYTTPQIAHTGMYETRARERGFQVRTFTHSFEDVDRAVTDGQTNGLIKVHVEKGSDRILGATIVANNAGDMISEITLAINSGIGLKKISSVIHPYPTQAEAIKKVADEYNRTRLSETMKKWFSRYFQWRR